MTETAARMMGLTVLAARVELKRAGVIELRSMGWGTFAIKPLAARDRNHSGCPWTCRWEGRLTRRPTGGSGDGWSDYHVVVDLGALVLLD
jgi:hypothetical protein